MPIFGSFSGFEKKNRKKIKKREESGHDENFTRHSGHCPRVSLADSAGRRRRPSALQCCLPASPMLRLPAPQDWRRGDGGSSGGLPAVPMRSSSAMTLNA